MIVVNTDFITGKKLFTIGIVSGNSVQSKHIGKDFMAGLKNIVGGELNSYNEMIRDSRNIAMQRMIEEAEGLGADAVINVRFSTSAIVDGAMEALAYGTAVKFED